MENTKPDPHHVFLARAIELARSNVHTGQGGPFGAIIVKNGKIIAEKSNEVTTSNDPTAHAEIQVIREACRILGSFQLDDCDLYTSCEPCPMCLGAIYWARPRAVYFAATRTDAANAGFDDDLIYQELPKNPRDRKIPMFHTLGTNLNPIKVFHEWASSQNKVPY